jgi:BNR repeat-like domain
MRWALRLWPGLGFAVLAALGIWAAAASANVALTKLSSDPYANATSQHATEVEPDSLAVGSTLVTAFQAGRFYSGGGASNVGWATSQNGGASWTHGFLPGVTIFEGGTYQRVSDPSIAYDAAHNTWLIASLPISGSTCCGAAVLVSRSTDATTWGAPVAVAQAGSGNAGSNLDKDWIVCDNHSSSPFYGHCYVEWDDYGHSDLIKMSTSTDGGQTWSAARQTANAATGLGGQPLVQPNGTVLVPTSNSNFSAILAFRSTDGGSNWSAAQQVASVKSHPEAGSLRSEVLPSAEIDGAGKVYVVWHDCRFRRSCRANDVVFSTSGDGQNWSAVTRIPIDGRRSGVDHFLPAIGVDTATSGLGAHLGVSYYYYPATRCSTSTCQLDIGFISSADAGQHWSSPAQLAGPMTNTWLAKTDTGYMVGDYFSTSFSADGSAHPVFALANPPSGTKFDEAIYTPTSGLAAAGGTRAASASGAVSHASERAAARGRIR